MNEFLHAYWRMDYVEAPEKESTDSLFSKLPQTQDDRKVYIIHRAKHAYIVMNKFPYNAGHLLVVPYKEVPDLDDLNSEERIEFMDLIITAQKILKEALSPQGFNIGFNIGCAGGAGIPKHIHCHVVPRWSGDTNFMPVIGRTRVLPQSLEVMWERLRNVAESIL